MIDDSELARRKALTFEQAEGLAELPRQLRPDELPGSIRGELLIAFVDSMERGSTPSDLSTVRYLGRNWFWAMKSLLVKRYDYISAEFENRLLNNARFLERVFKQSRPHEVLGVVQDLLRHLDDVGLAESVKSILERGQCAYRLFDRDTLIPVGSPEEAQVVNRALVDVAQPGFGGANRHLKNAGGGRYRRVTLPIAFGRVFMLSSLF